MAEEAGVDTPLLLTPDRSYGQSGAKSEGKTSPGELGPCETSQEGDDDLFRDSPAVLLLPGDPEVDIDEEEPSDQSKSVTFAENCETSPGDSGSVSDSPAVLHLASGPGDDIDEGNGTDDKGAVEIEDEEPSDLSKSVTFAEDVAIYSLGQEPIQAPLLAAESTDELASPDPNPAEDTPAVLELNGDTHQTPSPNLTPTISTPYTDTEESEDAPEEPTQIDDGEGQKHVFQVTRVDEQEGTADEGVDLNPQRLENGLEDTPRLDKVDSYMSDSGNSTLSYNQDTIGPLENQSFLRNLNYSVSQAAVNEAGEDGDDLYLNDFAGVKADVDGGWAWVILFAAVCSLALVGATAFSAGVFMPYILEKIEPDISRASWIGAVHTSVTCFSGPTVSSMVNRIGARWSAFVAGLTLVAGFVGSSFATSFLHLILTHGLLTGIGFGYVLNIMYVTTGQYFNRYRGFACGMLATGAGVGILAVGSILTFLVENFGLDGAYLLWAGICSHVLVFAMLLRPSNEEMIRSVEKKISAEQIKMNNANSGLNSLASGLNSVYSNGDVYSVFSGRTNDSRKLYRQQSKRSSRGDLASNPLLKNVLNKDVSDSRNSVNTTKSHRSSRSAALSNVNLSLPQNARLLDNTLLTTEGQSLAVPGCEGKNSPLLSRASNYTISPLALPEGCGDQPLSPSDKTSSSSPCTTSPTNHIHSNFSLANETIPEHEVVSKTTLEPPPSPTFSRSALSDFRKRLHSSTSHHTSYSQISHLVSMRGPMRNGDLDNESLTSTLVCNLRPKDVLEPRYRLGSRSIPTLFGSVVSFPTSLAIVKDDLSRIDTIGRPVDKSLRDYLIGLLDSLRLLRNYPFMLFTIACSFWALGEAPFFLYLPAFAISEGSSPSDAPSLYTALGFGSMFGRFLSGLVSSDKMIGPLLVHIGCLGLAGMVMTLTPVVASSWTTQMLCSGLFGLYTGALVPLLSLITIELLGISELGMGFGLLCMIQGVAYLAGPPLGGVLVKTVGFRTCFIIMGIIMTLGSVVGMLIAVLLGREVGGEEDEQGSLDDLERALRRVSNCMSSDSDDEDLPPGSPEECSDISRSRPSRYTTGMAKTEPGDGEDIPDAVQEGTSPKDESWVASGSPSNPWPEEQELETIDEEVEHPIK